VTAVSAVGRKEGSMGAPVVHFEIYGKDASKLQSFYADLFRVGDPRRQPDELRDRPHELRR
jgi:predicted enzyme related to lactoylglutathione lyase